MRSRFDHVPYDDISAEKSAAFKRMFLDVEQFVGKNLSVPPGQDGASVARSKALAMTKLEEAFKWIRTAIRDEQIALRSPSSADGGAG